VVASGRRFLNLVIVLLLLQLGTYNPMPLYGGVKEIRLKFERVKYWLSVGAQPTDTAAFLFAKANILPPPPLITAKWKKAAEEIEGAAEVDGEEGVQEVE
jgi:ribosomal protein S16